MLFKKSNLGEGTGFWSSNLGFGCIVGFAQDGLNLHLCGDGEMVETDFLFFERRLIF